MFVWRLIEVLETAAWVPTQVDRALLYFTHNQNCDNSHPDYLYNDVMSAYVDDCFAGYSEIRSTPTPWETLKTVFQFEDPAVPDKHVGQMFNWHEVQFGDDFRIVDVDMQPYATCILETYAEHFPDAKETIANRPITIDLRHEDRSLFTTTPSDLPIIQTLVGMILWLARCGRFDLHFPASQFAGRIKTWSHTCWDQMDFCISYIRKTSHLVLRLKVHVLDTPRDLRLTAHFDADFSGCKAYSCCHIALTSDRGTHIPVHFLSKRQSLAVDGTPAAEYIAGQLCVRESFEVMQLLGDLLPEQVVHIFGDNQSCLSVFKSGVSQKLSHLSVPLRSRINYVRDMIHQGYVVAKQVPSGDNKGDLGTKVHGAVDLIRLRSLCGIIDPTIVDSS